MNIVDKSICSTQGRLYEHMAKSGYDMDVFSEEFMSSEFCHTHFDTTYSPYQTEFACVLEKLLLPEIGERLVRKESASEEDIRQANAIGYIYRRLYMETSIPSAELIRLVPYREIMGRLENDAEWFEQGHKGEQGVFDAIMSEHALPRKRYDEGAVHMTHEELEKIDRESEAERLELEKKYCSAAAEET